MIYGVIIGNWCEMLKYYLQQMKYEWLKKKKKKNTYTYLPGARGGIGTYYSNVASVKIQNLP